MCSALYLCQLFVVLFRQILEGNVTWSSFSCEKLAVPCHSYVAFRGIWEAERVVCGASVSLYCSFWRDPRELTVCDSGLNPFLLARCHCTAPQRGNHPCWFFVACVGGDVGLLWLAEARCVMALHHGSCLVLLSLISGAMSCVVRANRRPSFCSCCRLSQVRRSGTALMYRGI